MSTPAAAAHTAPATSDGSLGERWRRARPGARAVIVIAALVVAVNTGLWLVDSATRGADQTGTTSSSFSTSSDGLAAYATLLGRYDHRVRAQRGDLADTDLDPTTTVVVLDPTHVSSGAARRLRAFLDSGGRLVAGGELGTWLHRVLDTPPTWSLQGVPSTTVRGDAPEVDGIGRVQSAGDGSWSHPGSTDVALGSRTRALMTVADVGEGRAVLLADASPLQNRLLGHADNAALGVAIVGEPGRTVVFAEGTHGYGRATGLAAVPARWKAAIVGTMLAALLTMLAAGRRVGPPEDEARQLPPPRRAYVDAVAGSLQRAKRPAESLAPMQAAARARLAQRAGLGPDADDAALRAAAARLGWPADEIGALFDAAREDRTVLAAGRALARIEGGES